MTERKTQLRISIAPGAEGPLASALEETLHGQHPRSQDYTIVTTQGDLQNLGRVKNFLRSKGYDLIYQNVYPAVRNDQLFGALKDLWQDGSGYWARDVTSLMISKGFISTEEAKAKLAH